MKSKYRNKPIVVDNIRFQSIKEAVRYVELKLLEKAGEISKFELQPRFPIVIGDVEVRFPNGRQMVYVADFYYLQNGKQIVEDVKGMLTDVYKIKRALMLAMGHVITEI